MKKITFLLAFMLAIVTGSYGQASSYSFAESTEVYTPVVGTSSTATGDDGIQNLVPIGFSFNFDGVAYTDFGISTNGWIKMGTVAIGGTSWTNALGNAAAHRPIIAPFWDDNNMSTGNIQYSLSGSSPNQVLEVGWDGIDIGGGGATSVANSASFKLRLYETTNVIEFVYGSTMTTAGALTASVGINGASTFLSVTPGATATTSSATANNAIDATTNLVGKKYIFTPPPPCTGTPVGGIVTPAALNVCSGNAIGNLVATGYTTGVSGITFQWQESPDGSSWSNAVGGTGATTTTYTPPVYSGTPIQYRLNVTCTTSGLSTPSAASLIENPATPTTQVSNVTATNLGFTNASVNWVIGNGNRRLVLLSDSPTFSDPVDGNAAALVANTVYAGSGQQIMYDGSAATVNITGLTTATPYYVKVYEYLRCGAGPYDYFYNITSGTNQITFSTLINNDLCANAITVACGSNTPGTTNGTTNDNAAVCGISGVIIQNTAGVWYKYIGDGSDVTVSTCPTGVNADTRIAVFSGDCSSMTCVAGNDDNPSCTTYTLTSLANFSTAIGTDYYILVYGYSSNSLNFTLGVTCVAACTPATVNNDCSTSESLTLNTTLNSNNSCASASLGTAYPSCGSAFGTYYDTWYSFNSDSFTSLNVSLVNGTSTAGFAVYSGTCGALTQINSTCAPTAPVTLTSLTTNTDYFVRVYSTSTIARGDFTLSVYDCASALPAPTGAASQAFCGSATVTDLVATGTAIKWYDAATLGNLLTSTDALVSGNTYYASQTVVCEGLSRLAVTVTLTAIPAAPTGSSLQIFCSTGSPDLTLLTVTSGGTGIVWYDAATLGNVLPNTTVLTATTYYAESVDGTCVSTSRLAITTTEDCPVAGCLNDVFGQYPGDAFAPDNSLCDGITPQEIADDCFSSEYSIVTVVLGETYIFSSSNATDTVTIGTEDGATQLTAGLGSVTWVATISGDVRFYTHIDGCDWDFDFRTRSVACGTVSSDLPDYVSLQSPSALNFAQGGSGIVYGQVYEGGLTEPVGQAAGITAWVGISPLGSNTNPNTWTNWVAATYNSAPLFPNNNDEYQATIGAALTPGTYYYATRFRLNSGAYVYGGIDAGGNGNFWNGTTHNSGVLTVTPPPVPANDECAGAISLVVDDTFCNGTNTNGTNLGATDSLVAAASCFEYGENDVWFTFVAPSDTATVDVSTDFLGGTLYDSEIALYSGACGSLTEISCGQDEGVVLQPNGFSWMSLITNSDVVAGETYYVRVSGYDVDSAGSFCLRVSRNTLSNETFNTSNFFYYPNPVKNILNLSYAQNISNVAVFNLLGQKVVSKVVNENQSQIDMSDLPTGAYLVKVTADNQVKTIKVIKE